MIPVVIMGTNGAADGLIELSGRVQDRFCFRRQPEPGAVRLEITASRGNALFSTTRAGGIRVSTWQSAGISRYAGLDCDAYLLLCSLLGLMQWRALALNPLLVEEDFVHPSPSSCLFSARAYKQDYALVLDEGRVCSGCLDFFRCLGAEPEVEALNRALAAFYSPSRFC